MTNIINKKYSWGLGRVLCKWEALKLKLYWLLGKLVTGIRHVYFSFAYFSLDLLLMFNSSSNPMDKSNMKEEKYIGGQRVNTI